ncbi:MAG: succinate dehydrogenase, cytochrome b556 subunit [Methylophilaceae bacterium]|nr:succinate dehydrogenase, cytochrome b556 subunit [Methylophilaceae bacterium]
MLTPNIKKNRPKNLNLFTIRLPINAVVSILHRVSGLSLFLMLPLLILAFQKSLASEASFSHVINFLNSWFMKPALIGLAWAFFHHFYAGLRHLAADVHWMTSLQKARFSGRVVLWLVAISVVIFTIVIW